MDSQGYIRSQNLQGYQNGNFADESFEIFANTQNNDPWDSNSINNESLLQPSTSHLNWQPSSALTTSLDAYGRPFSNNNANIQATPPYNYGHSRQFSQPAFDPSLVGPTSTTRSSPYAGHSPYVQSALQHGTIAPQALQHGEHQFDQARADLTSQGYDRALSTPQVELPPSPTILSVDQNALCAAVPKGLASGIFSVIDLEQLTSATNSKKVSLFLNIGQEDFEYPISKAHVPAPPNRHSRNDLRLLAKDDPKLLAKLGKRHHKKTHGRTPAAREQKSAVSSSGIKYEGDSSGSDYTSSEDSDDSDYSEDEAEPLPAKRPDTPLEAVKFDSIKATWRSRRRELDASGIKKGLVDFWEVVKTIRDRWKTDTAAVTEAEEKKKHGEIPLLKSRVKDQRDMFEAALTAALQHGHPNILELFGENHSLLYLFYQFLLDRHKSEDYDGTLTRAILQLLAGCKTLDEENLEKTRVGKVYPRFAKKGSAETQALVKRIDATVAESKKKKKLEAQTSAPDNKVTIDKDAKDTKSAPKSPPKRTMSSETVVGVKRAAPPSSTASQPAKRLASGPNGPASPATSLAGSKPTLNGKRQAPLPASGNASAAATSTTTKPKPAAPKVAGGVLSSGVRKPVTTKVVASSAIANIIKSIEKKTIPAVPAASEKSGFSFAETMANLTKSKEKETTPKEEDKRPTETEEQKTKRLRKEQRRKLRVTFKPDSELVKVRLFHHDVEEELGHDASMIRDVSDRAGEGRAFLKHKEMAETEEEEEAGEDSLRPYNALSSTDFSVIDPQERKRNFEPYGGGENKPLSPERAVRDQYEANTLMAYDSPPCPREPIDPYNGEAVVTKPFGAIDPNGEVATRLLEFTKQAAAAPQQITPSAAAPDISAILALINPAQQSHQQASQTSSAPSSALSAPQQVANLLGTLANRPQAGQPQTQSATPAQTAVMPNIADILANLNRQPEGPPQHGQPSQQMPQAPQQGAIDLAAILQQLQTNQSTSAVVPAAGNFGQFGFPPPNMAMQGFGQGPPQNNTFENEERRRWREEGGEDSSGRKWVAKKSKDKRFTLPCKYWKSGKCQKGTDCTYLHE